MQPINIEPAKIYHHNPKIELLKKIGITLIFTSLFILLVSLTGASNNNPAIFLYSFIGLLFIGSGFYFYAKIEESHPGIKNNNIFFSSTQSRGFVAFVLGIIITLFYVLIYWFPSTLENWIRLFDPLSFSIAGKKADQWFMYGSFYTIAILVMGTRMFVKYRHNRYQLIRTASVMFFQLGFAYLIPNLLKHFNQPEHYFTYFWPLKYQYLFPDTLSSLFKSGGIGYFMVFWGIAMSFIATPVLTYFFGKRWYCSWVCGCGGLAETAGDPFRQLSSKKLSVWKFERILIHSVLVFIVITTILVWMNSAYHGQLLGSLSKGFSKAYGFFIGAIFSGVIGVGFYPVLGNRVWCRYGCPMAAILGILQKYFSRFRITTNGSQCISCGNCSTYCEMGIDVRAYAQKKQNIIRASCVGCGICAAVCPRGVLKLENGSPDNRYNQAG